MRKTLSGIFVAAYCIVAIPSSSHACFMAPAPNYKIKENSTIVCQFEQIVTCTKDGCRHATELPATPDFAKEYFIDFANTQYWCSADTDMTSIDLKNNQLQKLTTHRRCKSKAPITYKLEGVALCENAAYQYINVITSPYESEEPINFHINLHSGEFASRIDTNQNDKIKIALGNCNPIENQQ